MAIHFPAFCIMQTAIWQMAVNTMKSFLKPREFDAPGRLPAENRRAFGRKTCGNWALMQMPYFQNVTARNGFLLCRLPLFTMQKAAFCKAEDGLLQRRRQPFRGAATAFKDEFCAFFDANRINAALHTWHSLHLNDQKPYGDRLFHGKPL